MRTNPPLRSQLQNDSAPFLNKLSINNREFGYTVNMRLFCYVKHIIVEKIANQSSNCSKNFIFDTWLAPLTLQKCYFQKKWVKEVIKMPLMHDVPRLLMSMHTIEYLIQSTTVKNGLV